MRDRIRLFLDKENKTSSQFAEEIGIQPSGVSHVLSGRNKPSLDFILKMLNTYKDLNSDWLLFGKGEMYKSGDNPELLIENEIEHGNIKSEELPVGGLFDTGSDTGDGEKVEKEITYGKDIDTNVNERFSERIIIFYPDGTYREYNRRK
jgi:transcriptional regulator with XRE-family HTH domain